MGFERAKRLKIIYVAATIAAIIAVASLNILPIMVAGLIGCIFMVITCDISMEEA